MASETPFNVAGIRMPTMVPIIIPTTAYQVQNNNNDYSQSKTVPANTQTKVNQKNGGQKYQNSKKGGQPYIPSYMDLANGPEPCVVCGDAATGYHYRCMTCEGCKGFFRRTIQKNLKYHCKWNGQCIIDKNTRNQCQQCRFQKCISTGMATDLVLNEKQRVAKRKLIEENRERRKAEIAPPLSAATTIYTLASSSNPSTSACINLQVQAPVIRKQLSDGDRKVIEEVVAAYDETSVVIQETPSPMLTLNTDERNNKNTHMWQQLAEIITPSIVKVVEFAKHVPGFEGLVMEDRILLLKSCCIEIMCLRAACRYSGDDQSLTLSNGFKLCKQQLLDDQTQGSISMLMIPIMEFAHSLSKLNLDKTEVAMLAATLLIQSDRTGLKAPEEVEKIQELLLAAFKRYVCDYNNHPTVRWAKILMKVTDLRTISSRHAERVLAIKLDQPAEISPLFLEVFDEGRSLQSPLLKNGDQLVPLTSPLWKQSIASISLSPLPTFSKAPSLGESSSNSPTQLQTPSILTASNIFWFPLPSPGIPPITPKTSTSTANKSNDDTIFFSPSLPKRIP